jgi:DNA-binding transcriptional ArsR family regulator
MNTILSLTKQFNSLGNTQRLKIYGAILQEAAYCDLEENPVIAENTSKALIKITKLSPATVTHHINLLKDAKLITEVTKGKYKYLFPNQETLELMRNVLKAEELDKKIIRFPNTNIPSDKFGELVDFLRVNGYRFKRPTKKQNQIRYYSANKEFIVVYSNSSEKIYLINLKGDLKQISELMSLIEKFGNLKGRR